MTAVLQVEELKTYFYTRDGIFKAVDGISLNVEQGKTLAIVGESGSGKSVSMLSLLGLIPQPPGKIVGGRAMFRSKDLLHLPEKAMQALRGEKIAMIFQDPMTSLNPYLRVGIQLTEGLRSHHRELSQKEARQRAIQTLEHVGIPDAAQRFDHFPHEFSGGMRQRVMIAMALISKPELLIADEPTTALDVTIQAQILNLLKKFQREMNLSIILITHDLGVVAGMADEICVMYAGKIVEHGSAEEIFYTPSHPYTIGLLGSTPRMDSEKGTLKAIPGLPPDPSRLPKGCPFAARCPKVMAQCRDDRPLPLRRYSATQEALCYWERDNG